MLRGYLALLAWGVGQTVFIENAEELSGTNEVRHLRGAVILRQDSIRLFCEEAELHQNNAFYARGNVRTFIGQSGTIQAERLSYDPNTQLLTYEGQVIATFGAATLRTPRLIYNRQTETASYHEGGMLTDSSGTIQSISAAYQVPTKQATFTQAVQIWHPPYQAVTDSLLYETDRSIATFPHPFTLYHKAEPETLSALSGQWYRQDSFLILQGRVRWQTADLYLKAQYAFYDQRADTGFAACEVFYQSRKGKGWGIADSAFWRSDTLILKENVAAFLFTERDTAFVQGQRATLISPRLYLTQEASFLRPPLSASADTIIYDTLSQNLFLLGHAWLYSAPYQLFAQRVRLALPQTKPDSLWAAGAVHAISQVDTLFRFYHQVRSDSLIAKWDSTREAFSPILFLHNLCGIYYQADGPHYQGAHHILQAQSLFLTLGPNRQPNYLRLQNYPKGYFIPIKRLLTNPLFLSSFQWKSWNLQPHWPITP